MSGGGGYLEWNAEFLVGNPFFDQSALLRGYSALSWKESDVIFSLLTHAGTHILQKPYYGANRPLECPSFEFQASFEAGSETDYFLIRRAKRRGAAVYFCPYLWTEEVFDATSGEDYYLTRPLADGIVTGVTSTTHPLRIFLDDVEDNGSPSATVSGQTVTAGATGILAIRYMPVFKVVVSGLSDSLPAINGLDWQCSFNEAIEMP
jgi:hypothetical protein